MTSRTVGRCATRRHAKGIAVGVANQSVSEPDERGQRGAPRLVHAGADKLEATLVAQTVIVQSRISRLSGVNDSALLLEHLSHSCRWPGSRIVPVQRRSEVIPPPTELRRAFFSLSPDPPARARCRRRPRRRCAPGLGPGLCESILVSGQSMRS